MHLTDLLCVCILRQVSNIEPINEYLVKYQCLDGTITTKQLAKANALAKSELNHQLGPRNNVDVDRLLVDRDLAGPNARGHAKLVAVAELADQLGVHLGSLEHVPRPGYCNP